MSLADAILELVPVRSALLESLAGVSHALTHRVPGLGAADGNMGYSAPRDRRDAWEMRQHWCTAAGFQAAHLVTLGQVHGADVHVVRAGDAGRGAMPGSPQIGLGDALLTADPGPVLMTLHADCQPIFVVDPARGRHGPVVAVVHAGWRGTVANVVSETVVAMHRDFGSLAADLHVFLGPAIGPCCYEVGTDVATAWTELAGQESATALESRGDRFAFSLSAANRLLLERVGIGSDRIETSHICTRCASAAWFSHRGQGPHTGRFGAMIGIQDSSVYR